MDDICDLILDDHEKMRRQFAAMDGESDPATLAKTWAPLADLLDLHAAAEEEIFYPCLLRKGDDANDETRDAIKDHNEIRDAVARARRSKVSSPEWWDAVTEARKQNSDHMAEEERGALADFRSNSELETRQDLGRRFRAYREDHRGTGIPSDDVDPDDYIQRQLG
ncbi:MAG TPA: hemerythrin domain-containing protein [Acidimicrobiales bacterium]|nr:hemerythrin domain-containing protein [Acidimicrobiales bacterium]